jgi:cytoskeletal protein RodZ
MNSIFQRLRVAREAKGLSVDDIAASTNINVNFLSSLEEGQTDILPQVYVRAFLRESASQVDLNPDEVIKAYEDQTRLESRRETEDEVREKPEGPISRDVTGAPSLPGPKVIATVVATVIVAGVLYWNFSRPSPEETSPVPPPFEAASDPAPASRQTAVTEPDSLLLRVRTADTVWILVVIDGRDSLEYVFRPNVTASWSAGQTFSVSVGRPEAVEFTLNDKPMGTLGTRRRIIRDSLITHQTLARLKEQ